MDRNWRNRLIPSPGLTPFARHLPRTPMGCCSSSSAAPRPCCSWSCIVMTKDSPLMVVITEKAIITDKAAILVVHDELQTNFSTLPPA